MKIKSFSPFLKIFPLFIEYPKPKLEKEAPASNLSQLDGILQWEKFKRRHTEIKPVSSPGAYYKFQDFFPMGI